MLSKSKEKQKAVSLRKKGMSYSEILKKVPVAKSTLSMWLRDVGLAKKQEQRLTKKKLDASKRGGAVKRKQRIERAENIYREAQKDIDGISDRELWLMGIMLYWAEGGKEKSHRPGSGTDFTNSDPRMIKMFLMWLLKIIKVGRDRIKFGIYIHDNHKGRIKEVIKYWSQVTRFPESKFIYVYFKKHNIKTKRKNIERDSYYGNLRVTVSASSELVRKITGWVIGIDDKI